MATTNYNLPTITGNMTADVVRDMNALAEATDEAIKEAVDGVDLSQIEQTVTAVDNRVTTHLADDALIKHKALQISVVNPETQVMQDMQAFVEMLFTDVSNGKQLIGTAITDLDPTKIVPVNPTFQVLSDLISGIVLGKKYAKGSVSSSSIGVANVVGLGFKPNIIIIYRNETNRKIFGVYVSLIESDIGVAINGVYNGSSLRGDSITLGNTNFSVSTGISSVLEYGWMAFE